MGEGRLHELPDQRDLVARLTAFSHTLLRPEELPEVLARAFAVFDARRPRPVHIELPLDVITAPGDHCRGMAPVVRPGPSRSPIAAAAAALARSATSARGAGRRRAGRGRGGTPPGREARALTGDHRQRAWASCPPAIPCVRRAAVAEAGAGRLREADVVLAVGTELGETDYALFDEAAPFPGER